MLYQHFFIVFVVFVYVIGYRTSIFNQRALSLNEQCLSVMMMSHLHVLKSQSRTKLTHSYKANITLETQNVHTLKLGTSSLSK